MKRCLKIACVMSLAIVLTVVCSGCPFSLSAARKLEGTWNTPMAVKFNIKTDFRTGGLEYVGYEYRMVEWKITERTENIVDIEQNFTITQRSLAANSGYVPDVSPNFYTGYVSSTELIVKTGNGTAVGEFTFTEDNLEGTWSDYWAMVYAQVVYTDTKDLHFERQK